MEVGCISETSAVGEALVTIREEDISCVSIGTEEETTLEKTRWLVSREISRLSETGSLLCVTDVAEGSPDGKTEDKSNSEEDGAVVETSVGLYSV